jgi:hypothetical protein
MPRLRKAQREALELLAGLPRYEVDERTVELTFEALQCRMLRHRWDEKPTPIGRMVELARLGQDEERLVCDRCGSAKTTLYELPNYEKVGTPRYQYSQGYLIAQQMGSRRILSKLTRADIKRALRQRQLAQLEERIRSQVDWSEPAEDEDLAA